MNLNVIVHAGISTGTILLIAAIGEILTERAGIKNLGVEGMMIMGAVTGFGVALLASALERRPEPRLTVVSVTVPDDEAASVAETVAAKGPRRLGVWRRTADGWLPR